MNLGAQPGPARITKLSPNWACQMGPIHCPTIFAVWGCMTWTALYAYMTTSKSRLQAAEHNLRVYDYNRNRKLQFSTAPKMRSRRNQLIASIHRRLTRTKSISKGRT